MGEPGASGKRRAWLVIGPHRSGGSALARLLSLAGAHLPRDLAAPSEQDEPAGFGVSRSIARLNEAILEAWGGSWRAPPTTGEVSQAVAGEARDVLKRMFPQSGDIILKDARLSLTGRIWADALEREGFDHHYLLTHREPAEIVASLGDSFGLDAPCALALWRSYAEQALQTARDRPHAVVHYASILEDPKGVLKRLRTFPPSGGWAEFDQTASAFLAPLLHGSRNSAALGPMNKAEDALARELDRLAAAELVNPLPATRSLEHTTPVTWLLISGAPRSGTSLLRALVDDHPDASILQEFGLTRFARGLAALVGRPPIIHPPWGPFVGTETALQQAASFYEDREARGGAGSRGDLGAVPFDVLAQGLFTALKPGRPRVIGDKMPMRGEWEDIDYLVQRLPELRLLISLRNPRAVINSSMIRRARQHLGGDIWPITSVQEAAEEWWINWRRAADLAERFGPAVHFVKYERLCEDVGASMQGVWDWLGLAPHAPRTLVRRLPAAIDALSETEVNTANTLLGEVAAAWDEEPDPHRLLARFAHLPRPYVPGRRLQAASEEADAIFAEGFSWREPWGRWTDGERALIRLQHGLTGGHGLLELRVARAFVPEGGACDVVMRVEGASPQLFSLGQDPARLALLCPLKAGLLEVELLVINPKSMLDSPADERRLGVGLESVSLRALS